MEKLSNEQSDYEYDYKEDEKQENEKDEKEDEDYYSDPTKSRFVSSTHSHVEILVVIGVKLDVLC